MNLHDYEKVPENQTLRGPDLLKPLPLQTKLFDNLSSSGSQSSELSGPFSDVVYNVVVESKRKAKKLFGKDLYTAFSFSQEFKTAMEEVKKEMIAKDPNLLKTESMVNEDFDICHTTSVGSMSEDGEECKYKFKFLQFPNIDYEVEKVEEEVEEKKKEKDTGREKKKKASRMWLEENETVFDTMSGYWRLLSVYDEFRISPPWYDAYAEGKEHWLQTKPIPPEVLENSRVKCLDWLNKHFEKK